jgi:class 3 adenylate cyclase/tetratricopeptide (TPR) repeat protein
MRACGSCGATNAADARFCSRCGAALGAEPRPPSRRTVTVLFCDLIRSTPLGELLDVESLHAVIVGRWIAAVEPVIERHGGRLDKFAGDSVLVVFGVPRLHEDDALRAARCALEMRAALAELNPELEQRWGVTLQARYGLSTGEVAITQVGAQPFVPLGDAANMAQRLQAAAGADEIYVGPVTGRLLEGVAALDPLTPLELKGKSAPVRAWRLLDLPPPGRGAPAGRLVGRRHQLRALRSALDDVIATRRCRLATVLGPAGIGKSYLVRSFLAGAEPRATVALGRCLSYGEGITFWPLAEIVEQLSDHTTADAIAAVVGDGDEARRVGERLAGAVGVTPGSVPIDEIWWAARRLFEAVAEQRPLIVVVEDVHWAEPALLELLEHVARNARDVPLLLVCLARPDGFAWEPEVDDAIAIRLAPLPPAQAARLLDSLDAAAAVGDDERERLLATAEGNPFFLEQMVAMRRETGAGPPASGSEALPALIEAVLAARIDALPDAERAVLECAAIEGRQFHRGIVAELLEPEQRAGLDDALAALTARDMIRHGRADVLGTDAYRFSHILVREAIYGLLPKARRADLHESFAGLLLARQVTERELGEIVGFHLEQAYWYRARLERVDAAERERLAGAGAAHLAAAGRAAVRREDVRAGVNLLRRAVALLDPEAPELGTLLPQLGDALTEVGSLAESERVLGDAVARAAARGDAVQEAHARVGLLFARLQSATGSAAAEVVRRFDELRATFEAREDAHGLDRLWRLRALVHWLELRAGDADAAWERAVGYAQRADDEHGRTDALSWLASSALAGPLPASEAIERCEAIRADLGGNHRAQAFVLGPLASLRAMRGEFGVAHQLVADSRAMFAELGLTLHTTVPYHHAVVALLDDEPAAAEAALRTGYERLREMGEKALLADTAMMLARAVTTQGRLDEALALTVEAEEGADAYDVSVQVGWRTARAAILVRRGGADAAVPLVSEALTLLEHSDWITDRAETLTVWAEVLAARGDPAAAAALGEAQGLHERKGNVVAAARVRNLIAQHSVA